MYGTLYCIYILSVFYQNFTKMNFICLKKTTKKPGQWQTAFARQITPHAPSQIFGRFGVSVIIEKSPQK